MLLMLSGQHGVIRNHCLKMILKNCVDIQEKCRNYKRDNVCNYITLGALSFKVSLDQMMRALQNAKTNSTDILYITIYCLALISRQNVYLFGPKTQQGLFRVSFQEFSIEYWQKGFKKTLFTGIYLVFQLYTKFFIFPKWVSHETQICHNFIN